MRILVEFTDPFTDEKHEFKMDGPDINDLELLRKIVLESIRTLLDEELSEDLDIDLKISEIASGTVH